MTQPVDASVAFNTRLIEVADKVTVALDRLDARNALRCLG